jgi:hypothetical protein
VRWLDTAIDGVARRAAASAAICHSEPNLKTQQQAQSPLLGRKADRAGLSTLSSQHSAFLSLLSASSAPSCENPDFEKKIFRASHVPLSARTIGRPHSGSIRNFRLSFAHFFFAFGFQTTDDNPQSVSQDAAKKAP